MTLSEIDNVSLRQKGAGVELMVRVNPKARKGGVAGVWRNALRIGISAPPEAGKANKELCDLCSRLFGLPKTGVKIIRGEKSRNKTLFLSSTQLENVRAKVRSILAEISERQ